MQNRRLMKKDFVGLGSHVAGIIVISPIMRLHDGGRMLSIYRIKPAFQNSLRPLVRLLATSNITPNQVTIAAVLLSLAAGGFILFWPDSRWPFFLLPIALIVRMGLNAVDGMLAREHDMTTKLGGVLNELGDVVSDSAMYLTFAVVPGVLAPVVVIVVLLAVIAEMTGVLSIHIGGRRRYDGPMGKSDRAFVFGALALAKAFGFEGPMWVNGILMIVALLLVITIFARARGTLREAADVD
jgi:CDP-diacylglycerol--glycerol-3-phosphate 3-phosphatidyltransferase